MEAIHEAQWCRFFMEICALLGGVGLSLSLLYEVALPVLRRFAARPERWRQVTEP